MYRVRPKGQYPWLFYYRNKIYVDNHEGFSARVDCLWRIFTAGFNRIEYEFFTVFEFGERHFDTIFEMGDEKAVLEQIRKRYQTNPTQIQTWRKLLPVWDGH